MANKYAPVIPERSLFDGAGGRGANLVKWDCRKCKKAGAVPRLFDRNDTPIAERIRVGHQRATSCHDAHEMRHVYVAVDGKSVSFSAFELTSASRNPKPGEGDGSQANARG